MKLSEPQREQVEIAKLHGYIGFEFAGTQNNGPESETNPRLLRGTRHPDYFNVRIFYYLPDYSNNLDAIHEVIEHGYHNFGLTWHRKYIKKLHEITVRDFNKDGHELPIAPEEVGWFHYFLTSQATAKQKAEALIKTSPSK